jgi:hypothetical protein
MVLNNIYYVYIHYRKDNLQPFYVGKGKCNRAFGKGSNRSKYWNNIVKKHGVFVQIMERNLTEAEAFQREKFYIHVLGKNNLCNITDGGEGCSGMIPWNKGVSFNVGENNPMYGKTPWNKGKSHSDETKKIISLKRKGVKNSDETKKKISEKLKGKFSGAKNPMYNKKLSNETKLKISQKLKGKKHSLQTKEKISLNRKGKGKGILNGGKNPNSRKIINSETGEIYNSLKEVSELLNINYYTFFNYLNGRVKNKTTYKYY